MGFYAIVSDSVLLCFLNGVFMLICKRSAHLTVACRIGSHFLRISYCVNAGQPVLTQLPIYYCINYYYHFKREQLTFQFIARFSVNLTT